MLKSGGKWGYILTRVFRTVIAIIAGLFLLCLTLSVAVQLPFIQNRLIDKTTEVISNSIEGKIDIGRIYVIVPNRLVIKNISIVCGVSPVLPDSVVRVMECSDTLLNCNKLSISLSTGNLLIGRLKLNRLELNRGVVNILNEEPKRTNLERAFKIEKNRKKEKKESRFVAAMSKFRMHSFRFTFKNPYKPQIGGENCINWANIRLSDINIDIRNIKFRGDTIFASIRDVQTKDAGGLECRKVNGDVIVCSTGAYIKNLVLWDGYSKLYASRFNLAFEDPHALANFTKEVSIEADLTDAIFSLRSLARVSPNIPNCDGFYTISGSASGPVEHLRGKNIVIESTNGEIRLNVDYEIDGLPDYRSAIFKIKAKDSYFNTNTIADILSSFSNEKAATAISKITPGIRYSANAEFKGPLNDAAVSGGVSSDIGNISFNGKISGLLSAPEIYIATSMKGVDVNVGSILDTKSLGKFTFSSTLNASVPRREGEMVLNIDSLGISSAKILEYEYSNIVASGKIKDAMFDGRLACHDPNMNLLLQGVFNLGTLNSEQPLLNNDHFKIFANVPYANLAKLKLFNRDSTSIVSFKTMSTFDMKDGVFLGEIKIFEPAYRNENGEFRMSDVVFTSRQEGKNYKSSITSNFLNGGYQGTVDIISFIYAIIAKSIYKDVNGLFPESNEESRMSMRELMEKNIEGELQLTTGDTRAFLSTIMPELRIEKNSKLNARIETGGGVAANFSSKGVSFGNNVIYSPQLFFVNSGGASTLRINSEEFRTPVLNFENIGIDLRGKDNRVNGTLTFKNDSTGKNSARIDAVGLFSSNNKSLQIEDGSYLILDGHKWNLSRSTLKISGEEMLLESFSLKNKNQEFTAGGVLGRKIAPDTYGDSLNLKLQRFNISMFNSLLNKPLNLQGVFSGESNYSSLSGIKKMQTDISADSVYIYGNQFGNLKIQCGYSTSEQRYEIELTNDLKGKRRINATGYLNPWENRLNMNIVLNNLSSSYFEPFLTGIFSGMKGDIEAHMKLEGPLDKLSLTSNDFKFKDFKAKLDYTNVIYTISGGLLIDEKGIVANNLKISDGYGGEGSIHGGVSYKYFKDISFNTRIELKNLLGLNTSLKDNQSFYGNVKANGNVGISGGIDNIKLILNVSPSSKGNLHIPLSSNASSRKSNLLTFKENYIYAYDDESYMPTFSAKKKSSSTNIDVELFANVNSQVDMFIDMGRGSGDMLRGNGNGMLTVTTNGSGETMNIYGTYTLEDGDYRFSLGNFALATRTFKLNSGGTINFNGPLDNTKLNLSATYSTKASISTLIADTSSVSTRRAVNCGINLDGDLTNPKIGVSIDIPDLDPTTKVRVESALNTEGKKQKQFAALLLSGGFVPDENSGITNNSTILYSNASDILSNQLNGILQQLGIPLDLGLNYQPTDKGQSVFDVAVSTALFNNRIIVNGNIGNDPHTTGRNVIGNVDVEIKLDEKGKLRLTLFSHSADKYSNYLDNKQRTGLGVSYQREFNNRHDILPKRSKEQKEKDKAAKALKKELKKNQKNK